MTQPKGYSKRSNNFKHYGSLTLNLGDVFIVPGECLHYGVTRTNQNLLAVTVCPKFGSDIHFSQNMIAHRSLQTFIHVIELYWNDVHKKKMIDARKRLLRWFVLYFVLQSCNQRRVSSELRDAYPKQLYNIVSKIETQFLNLDDNTNNREEDMLPKQEKHCFEPTQIQEMFTGPDNEDKFDTDDPEEQQYQRELKRNQFQLKPEIQNLCNTIFQYLKQQKAHERDDLFT